jgi:very-short-patch-repair endonuclease
MRPKIRAASFYGGRDPELPRALRRRLTDAEAALWRHLRAGQLQGRKFRRQQALGPYIVDFYCHECGLIVEVDGGQHFDVLQLKQDQVRTDWLEARGLRVLRFTNLDILNERELVLERILVEVEARRPHPSPLPEGEGTR